MALHLVKDDDVGIVSGNYHNLDSAGFLSKFFLYVKKPDGTI